MYNRKDNCCPLLQNSRLLLIQYHGLADCPGPQILRPLIFLQALQQPASAADLARRLVANTECRKPTDDRGRAGGEQIGRRI